MKMLTTKKEFTREIDTVVTVLVCLVAIGTLVPPALAKPVHTGAGDFDAWWYNACDSHSTHHHHKNHCPRHNLVHKNTRRLVGQSMCIFYSNLKMELQNINSTYAQVMSGFTNYSHPGYEWLPKYKKPTEKRKELLGKFHVDLQKYVVAVHHLTTLTVVTDAKFDWTKRKSLLTALSVSMKHLLCDIETAVNATCQEIPERIPATFVLKKGLNKHPKTLTEMYLTDWDILNRFSKFMNQSIRLVDHLPMRREPVSVETQELDASATLLSDVSGE